MVSSPTAPFTVYDAPTHCTGGPSRGALSLRDRILQLFPGTTDEGTYSCRNTRTGQSLSEHAEGRADDIGVRSVSVGNQVAQWAYRYASALGIQTIIWNDQIWTSKNPNWRPYNDPRTGRPFADPTLGHRDHVHIGLNRAAAGGLTGAALQAAGQTVNGTLAGVGSSVAGFGGDLVGSAVQPFLDGLRKLTLTGLFMAAGVVLVAAGAYRATTGRSAVGAAARGAKDVGKLAVEAGEAVATGGTSTAATAATKGAGAAKAAGTATKATKRSKP